MRRKQRAVPARHRKATFSRTELKRAIKTATSVGLPVTRIDLLPNGGLSLVVGDTGKADDTNTKRVCGVNM